MTSDGTPWRPLVHVRDICEAIAAVLAAPRATVHNQILNVGDDRQNLRVREIAEIVAEEFPGCRLSFGAPSGDNRSYRVGFAKIRQVLPGFRCRYDVRAGAQELREVYERVGLTREKFQFRAFTRLKQLEHLLDTRQIDPQFFWKPACRFCGATLEHTFAHLGTTPLCESYVKPSEQNTRKS